MFLWFSGLRFSSLLRKTFVIVKKRSCFGLNSWFCLHSRAEFIPSVSLNISSGFMLTNVEHQPEQWSLAPRLSHQNHLVRVRKRRKWFGLNCFVATNTEASCCVMVSLQVVIMLKTSDEFRRTNVETLNSGVIHMSHEHDATEVCRSEKSQHLILQHVVKQCRVMKWINVNGVTNHSAWCQEDVSSWSSSPRLIISKRYEPSSSSARQTDGHTYKTS